MEKITLVGAGIVNVITAFYLIKNNYKVVLLDKSRSPILNALNSDDYGCTLGGLDARMYSLTESDNYNEKHSKIYSQMSDVFSNSIQNGGWSALRVHNIDERKYIKRFRNIDSNLAWRYSHYIYELTTESYNLWQELFNEYGVLFENTNLNNLIYRTYVNETQMEESRNIQNQYGMLVDELSKNDITEMIPGFDHDNNILCGALRIKGFTLQVHRLYFNLIKYIEKKGGRFVWEADIERIDECRGYAISKKGEEYYSDHFVVSIGANQGNLLSNYKSNSYVHGVLGVWKVLPQPNTSFRYSLKIKSYGHTLEDVNVTPIIDSKGNHWLILGGGYAYIGTNSLLKNNWSNKSIDILYRCLDDIANIYFPDHLKMSKNEGIKTNQRFCIRPWTPSGLGLYEIKNIKKGLIIITGGHNTGGFSLAPSVAKSVVCTLKGESSKMEKYYSEGYKY